MTRVIQITVRKFEVHFRGRRHEHPVADVDATRLPESCRYASGRRHRLLVAAVVMMVTSLARYARHGAFVLGWVGALHFSLFGAVKHLEEPVFQGRRTI